MVYLLFVINYMINWCLICITIAFGLQYFGCTWGQVMAISTILLTGSLLFFSTTGRKYLRIDIPHRPLSGRERYYLEPIVNEVFSKAELKNPPKVFIHENKESNAMVVGDALILHTGLLRIASREELAAVIAHEVGHIKNKDLQIGRASCRERV